MANHIVWRDTITNVGNSNGTNTYIWWQNNPKSLSLLSLEFDVNTDLRQSGFRKIKNYGELEILYLIPNIRTKIDIARYLILNQIWST